MDANTPSKYFNHKDFEAFCQAQDRRIAEMLSRSVARVRLARRLRQRPTFEETAAIETIGVIVSGNPGRRHPRLDEMDHDRQD